ncbi:phosphatase PAP2 family protein [Natrarchaeobaculum aegyptiacum]|nr:phosphatase PAP2 family protein [Natrarchaeobaculum aegyptiacum]
MDRSVGEIEFAQRLVPDVLYPAVEAITRLGDVSVLVAVTVVVTVVLERDRALAFFGIVIGGFAILGGLKAALALGRPPGEVHLIETATTGFPSGHALGAAVVYGGLALALERGRRLAVAVVAPLVVAIALSRIVLGVHYLVDVVVGLGVGVAYLAAVDRIRRSGPERTLWLATALGLGGVFVGIVFGPTPRTACLGPLCLDQDTIVPAAAGIGALLTVRAGSNPVADHHLRWLVLVPVAVVGGGVVVVTDSVLLSSAIVAGIGGAGVTVLAGRGGALWES